jgi:release factor glutamine methyltransferase
VQAEVRDFEPATALYAACDGLAALAALVDDAPRVLRPGGWLVVEVGDGQADAVAGRARRAGRYGRIEIACDYAGIARVVAAERAS